MKPKAFKPTPEQEAVIAHKESAFISACPGAGKTQVLVERARQELKNHASGQGLVFLSFTNAAISELKARLQSEALLPNPPFPHYVGTFDTFIWQFFIAPLGIPGCITRRTGLVCW
jgi:superfamily I DNA/RNA helicase